MFLREQALLSDGQDSQTPRTVLFIAIGEYEAMLNSSPGKGIIDTGCAKMMVGSKMAREKVQVMATPSTDQTGGFKRFSGAAANGRDLKRWKSWCLPKMMTMTTLTKEARGPFAYSMLDGDALLTVEHLQFRKFAIEGGENVIFTIQEARYPDKDPIDRACKSFARCVRGVGT